MKPDREVLACPICMAETVMPIVAVPQVPVLCNVLWPTADEAVRVPRTDLRLGYCRTCGHVYNTAFDPTLIEYTQAYENSLHFSARFREYADALSDHLIDKYHLYRKTIIEIGCGKADFLWSLCRKGQNKGIGFDPSAEPDGNVDSDVDVTIVQDMYTDRYDGYEADFICCRQVLEHIQQPLEFISLVRRAIGERRDVAVFFEVPNVRFILHDVAIWDLIYEHFSYFSSISLACLFRQCGFTVCDLSETFGDQYLCIEAIPSDTPGRPRREPIDLGKMNREVQTFARRYERKVARWRRALEEIGRFGHRAVIWGAGSKGVTLSNILDAKEHIPYLVDINPRKQNMYVSGTGQRIVAPEFLRSYQPDVVILTNALYEDEISAYTHSLGLAPSLLVA